MVTVWKPSEAFEDWVMQLIKTAAQVCGVPRFAMFNGRRRRMHRAAKVVVSTVLRETGISYPKMAFLLGLDHTALICMTKRAHEYRELIARTKALIQPFEGSPASKDAHLRCPTCGRFKTVGVL